MNPELDDLMQSMLDRLHPGSSKFSRLDATHAEVRNVDPDLSVCDFCGTVPAVRDFEARNVDTLAIVVGNKCETVTSVGAWAACEMCTVYIVDDRRKELLLRSIAQAIVRFHEMMPEGVPAKKRRQALTVIKQGIESSHASFWAAKL